MKIFLILLLSSVTSSVLCQLKRSPDVNPHIPAMKADLKVIATAQGSCKPLTFRVLNMGGTNSGAFIITITDESGKIINIDSVDNIKPKGNQTFRYSVKVGYYTIIADGNNAVDEITKKNNELKKVEVFCIK